VGFEGSNIGKNSYDDYAQQEGQEFHQLRQKMREFDLMGVYKAIDMAEFFPEDIVSEIRWWIQAMKDIELLSSQVDLSLETLLDEIAMEDSTRFDFVVSSAGRHHNLESEDLRRQRACSRISRLMPFCSMVRMKIQMSLKENWTREDWTDFWRLKLFDFQDPSCNRKKAELFMENLWLSEDESFLRDWPHWDANTFEG
jgi:hypothetical protein